MVGAVAKIEAKGIVVREPGGPARLERLVVDPPGPGEVRVRLLASGVCHTDLHARLGHFDPKFPYLLGHEGAGVVESVGEGVEGPRVGDRVILNWRSPCGRCRFCREGRAAYCARPKQAGERMRTEDGVALGRVLGLGTFTTHTVVDAGQAVVVPERLDPAAVCLVGCGVVTGVGAATTTAQVAPGSSVAVFGCGAVGMSVIQGARLSHAARIVAVDVSTRKLEWAREMGATDAVEGGAGAVEAVRGLCRGGVDYAFEAVGLPETLEQAISSLALGGTCVLIGVPAPKSRVTLSMMRLFYSRARVVSCFYGDCLPQRDFPQILRWYESGQLDLDALVTERIPLTEAAVESAFTAMQQSRTLRSVILFGDGVHL